MNLNFIRTLLTWAAIVVMPISTFLGCTTLPDLVTVDCSASWIGPKYGALVATALLVLNQILKATQGGGFGLGLVAKTVVVSETKAAGTVTPAQVSSGSK